MSSAIEALRKQLEREVNKQIDGHSESWEIEFYIQGLCERLLDAMNEDEPV